jgi:hypothetical protein
MKTISPAARAEFDRKRLIIEEAYEVSLISREKALEAIAILRKKYLS